MTQKESFCAVHIRFTSLRFNHHWIELIRSMIPMVLAKPPKLGVWFTKELFWFSHKKKEIYLLKAVYLTAFFLLECTDGRFQTSPQTMAVLALPHFFVTLVSCGTAVIFRCQIKRSVRTLSLLSISVDLIWFWLKEYATTLNFNHSYWQWRQLTKGTWTIIFQIYFQQVWHSSDIRCVLAICSCTCLSIVFLMD